MVRLRQKKSPHALHAKSCIRVLWLAASILAVVTPRLSAEITLVSRLSDARAFAQTDFSHSDAPPPQTQTDYLPAQLTNSAHVPAGGSGVANASSTSNSSIVADNSMGTLRVMGDGTADADGFSFSASAHGDAKLIVLSFTLTDISYAYALTGQLTGVLNCSDYCGVATAKLTTASSTIFQVAAGNGNPFTVTLSQTGILPPDTYTLSVDLTASISAPFMGAHGNSHANFTFALDSLPTPTPTPTPTPPPPPTPTPTPSPTATPPPPTPSPTPTPVASPTPFFSTILYENFDYTVPPALPPNWNTSFTSGPADCTPTGTCAFGTNWATTKSNPYSGPICVHHDAPACVTDSVLDTRSFHLPVCYPVFASFYHSFNLESGRDGGVLEISINGGSFTDIQAAGGGTSYNGTISTGFLSPIAGRPAWTGNSGGYQSTGFTLPPAAAGQDVVLRFRLATDCSGGGGAGTGWSIDVLYLFYNNEMPPVSISGRIFYCNPAPGPTPPVSGVQMTLSGCTGGPPTTTSGTGDYSFQSLPSGGNYVVTPSKAARVPASPGINTLDVLAVQKHFLGSALLTGCRLTAANVTPPAAVNTLDVIAIQHFFLGQTAAIGDTGKYQFSPVNRTYFSLMSSQGGQNFDAIILGDVAGPFVSPP